jgi:hypothetical protein
MQRNGSETLSTADTSPQETLTSGQSLTCGPTICADTSNAISSPGLAVGLTHSGLPDGPMIAQAGRAPAHVSRFRALDTERAMPTNDTSGPLFTALSPSARLQSSLESRLRAQMDVNGSPEYALTWKLWDMPAGPPICALRASGRRTSGNGYSGWPTPMAGTPARNGNSRAGSTDNSRRMMAILRGYPTPRASKRGPRNPATANAKLITDGRTQHHRLEDLLTSMAGSTGYPNPSFLLWLMGFPTYWIALAPQEMPSSRNSGRRSSVPL